MDILLTTSGKTSKMSVNGIITSDNAYLFQDKLNDVLKTEAKVLELDLSECRNISSTGIGKLLLFYKEFLNRGGEIEITKCSLNVYELFTTIKLNQLFTVNL